MLSSDWEKYNENFSECTSRQESNTGIKKKKKNSHFSDIFFYQTLNIILGREKKDFSVK